MAEQRRGGNEGDWTQVWALFDGALEIDAAQRMAWLNRQCDDAAVCREVAALLCAHEAAAADPRFAALQTEEEAPLLAVGARVGAWRVVRLIGRGGMGQVFEVARADGAFRQRAALKLLARMDAVSDAQRFAQEREILARLEDPGIARLLDGGIHEQRPYAVLEFVEGRNFSDHAAVLNVAERVRLLLQVCDAVAAAHRSFIVHRDLKPGNVLVTAEGRVKLLDFGIAKLTDPGLHAADVTQVLRLSPDYCAPEQLQNGSVTAATDVYALGVMLYELLVDARPWLADGPAMTRALARLQTLDVQPPSQRAPASRRARVRGDLDAIALKALRPDPRERYPSVEALAADLRSHLDGHPVAARSHATAYVLGCTLRRYRWWFASAAAVFLSLALGLAGTAWQARQARIERDVARQEADRADAVRQYLIYMFRTAGESESPETLTAKAVLDEAAKRLQDEFADDPVRAAAMMQALGELYFFMSDYEGGIPLLQRMLAIAAAGVEIEPATLARVNYDLGQMYYRSGRADEAAPMLVRAQAFWAAEPERYRRELADSRTLQAQLQRAAGDLPGAIATLEGGLIEGADVFDVDDVETGTIVNNLGLLYFHAGRLDEADHAFEKAWRVWEARRNTRGGDALNTLNNWAAVATRRGDHARAEDLYRRALETRRALFGPSSALAALLSNYGKLMLLKHDAAAAKPLLEEAVSLARTYAGERSPHLFAAMAGLADAHTQLGETQQAAALLAPAHEGAVATVGAAHPLSLMVEVSQVRLDMAERRYAQASRRLDEIEAGFRSLGPSGAAYLTQTQQLRAQLPTP